MGLTQLSLEQRGHLSDLLIIHLSSIVAQSELTNIVLWMGDTDVRVRILETIQWPHLRYLEIYPTPRDLGDERVMRALVDGVQKMSDKVELDLFIFWSDMDAPLALPKVDVS